jgi:molybdenum cofactor guanylyltransferase
VTPFIYHRNAEQDIVMAQLDQPPARCPPGGRDNEPYTEQPGAVAEAIPRDAITAVIMAGGKARRMGGQDKGLLVIRGKPMIQYVLDTLRPQVGKLLINANRNQDRYRELGYPVVADLSADYLGPLVGMASAMQASDTEYLLSVPCDSPLLPARLAEVLFQALHRQQAEISVAHDGQRMQPVFALLRRRLLPSLLDYLEHGGRKIDTWYAQHATALADCSGFPDAFLNVNSPEDQVLLERKLAELAR